MAKNGQWATGDTRNKINKQTKNNLFILLGVFKVWRYQSGTQKP